MAAGELVDDELVESVVRDRLAIHDWNYGFIVDGFPRNARQAEFFLESYDIDGVINLEMPDEVVAPAGAGPPAVLGVRARLEPDGPPARGARPLRHLPVAPLVAREDDQPEALAGRLRDYHDKTEPVIDLFQRKEFVVDVRRHAVDRRRHPGRDPRRLNLPALSS